MIKTLCVCLLIVGFAFPALSQMKITNQTSNELLMQVEQDGKVHILKTLKISGEAPVGQSPQAGKILFSNDAEGNLYWSDQPETNDYLQWNGSRWITTAPVFQTDRDMRMDHFEPGSIAECTNGGEMYDAAVCSATEGTDYGFSYKTHDYVSVIELVSAGSNYGSVQTASCRFWVNYWTGSAWSSAINSHDRSNTSPNDGVSDRAFQTRYTLSSVPDGSLIRYGITRLTNNGSCAILMAGWTNTGFQLPVNSMGRPNPWVRDH